MQTYPRGQGCTTTAFILNFFFIIASLLVSNSCFADGIIITGNNIITKPTKYNNVVLDMSNGNFTVKSSGALDIQNSVINITISPTNPNFALIENGKLFLKNNTFNVSVSGILQNPDLKSIYQLVEVEKGNINLDGNSFTVNTPFTVGMLETKRKPSNDLVIKNNIFKNFHGGIYLINSDNAAVNDNIFENVTFPNIFNKGKSSQFRGNIFSFPGNLVVGDAFDIVNSSRIDISNNIIASSSGYSIYIVGGQNINLGNNKITDGSSYAIFIETPLFSSLKQHKYLLQFLTVDEELKPNNKISIIDNYISQNRYGLTGGQVDHLFVQHNTFIQKFPTSSARQNWTNNDTLLPLVTDLIWSENQYKEAFTQEVPGDNTRALQFFEFPQRGGVYIP